MSKSYHRVGQFLQAAFLAGVLFLAGTFIVAQGPGALAIAQEPGEPGFCHNNPSLCTQWSGAGCDEDCSPTSGGPCCQPEEGDH